MLLSPALLDKALLHLPPHPVGTMFGPCITGPTLAILGKQPDSDSYAFRGYVGVMMLGVVRAFPGADIALS